MCSNDCVLFSHMVGDILVVTTSVVFNVPCDGFRCQLDVVKIRLGHHLHDTVPSDVRQLYTLFHGFCVDVPTYDCGAFNFT